MSYVVPIHCPSGVRKAIKLKFLEGNEESLIVAKANRLEVYAQGAEGLVLVHTRSVYGYITMLERLRPAASPTDHLYVGTDRYQYFTCSWDAETKQIKTEQSYVDQADKVLRDSREMDRCHIDPSGRFMTLEIYDGVVSVVPIHQPSSKKARRASSSEDDVGKLGEPSTCRIEEMLTRDSAFLEQDIDEKTSPRLAILWEDNLDTPQLKIRELKYYTSSEQASVELQTVAELRTELDLGVSHLIPVPAPFGGFLILGERTISYTDSQLDRLTPQDLGAGATVWTCWTRIDERRWLLADDYGRLWFLMIETNRHTVLSWRVDLIAPKSTGDATASKASCLVYLDDGYVFVGSHSGDSQVIQIIEGGIQVVQTFSNIAPVLDFQIMDLGRGAEGGQSHEFSSGQARIVTASGAWQDGTIRSVRSGVGIEELGTIGELANITDLWSLDSTGSGENQDILLVTFVDETRILKFDENAAVEEVDNFFNLDLSTSTLYAANLPDRKIVQVCETGIKIADIESGMLIFEWTPSDTAAKITTACANSVHLLVVEAGHTLHVFHTATTEPKPTTSKTFTSDSQISGVTVPDSQSNVCIVSFWQTASIAILDLHTLDTLHTQSLGEPGSDIPRSVIIANILPEASPTLFIAMADGTVMTFSFDPAQNVLSNSARILLGTEPAFFKTLPRRSETTTNLSNVFATCEQPSLMYSSEGRIIYSAVNSDKASRICHFNSKAYPDAIAIATPNELKLAMIGTERATQLQTLNIGETVRCIAYEPKAKMFGIGCVRRILEVGTEALLSCVKIVDEVGFRELDNIELNDRELVECIVSTGSMDDDAYEPMTFGEMFIVGTSIMEDPDQAPDREQPRGRILVYEVNKEKKLKLVTEQPVKGACRSLAMCEGMVVAGLVKTVVLFGLRPSMARGRHSLELTRLASYRSSTNPLSLSITPSSTSSPATIAVADLMKSLSVLAITPPTTTSGSSSGYQLVEVARHFASVWSSATTTINENEWLLADMEGNICVLRRNAAGVTRDDQKRLEVVGEFRLGEVVNKIVPITSPTSSGTSSGTASKGKDRSRTLSTAANPMQGIKESPKNQRQGPLITPKAFMATVEGAIYLHGSISAGYMDALLRLQSALASRVQAPGYMPWNKFRAWRTEVRENEEPFRFVDGEMLEQGLMALNDDELEELLRSKGLSQGGGEGGLEVDVAEVRSWAEALRRLC